MDARIILDRSDIMRLPISWYDFNGPEQRALVKSIKELTGNRWDSNRLYLEYQRRTFPILVSSPHFTRQSPYAASMRSKGVIYDKEGRATNVFEIHLWDSTGLCALGGWTVIQAPDEIIGKEMQKAIREACELFVQGKLHCSDCREVILKSEIAGSYFAGKYCEKCWEGKWRAIEAKETYN